MLRHQYNANGSHRIVKLDIAGFLDKPGEWVGYTNIATFTGNVAMRGVKTYIAFTEYYEGEAIKANVIYELVKTDKDIDAGSEDI